MRLRCLIVAGVVLLALAAKPLSAYSVLSHEAIIDTLWENSIKPLLLDRFPQATPADLMRAHAYVYGGSIIQDVGYYPFGSKFFSNLAHYARTGDFVLAMLRDSRTLEEYAFALGALAHYSADVWGHPVAINRAVPMLYPKLGRKFGKEVTYDQAPLAHVRTEFAFDVIQVAHNYYAPEAYHQFIGFSVAQDLMKRAFRDTYCIELSEAFPNLEMAIRTYRWSVRTVIPEMTRVAWSENEKEITHTKPGMTKKKFLYNLSRASFEREWGKDYHKPGVRARFIAFLIRLLPKVGAIEKLKIPVPTPSAERLFMASFNDTVTHTRADLRALRAGRLHLTDENFDIGIPSRAGIYPLSDETYAQLLDLLAKKHFAGLTASMRDNILAYYKNPLGPLATRQKPREWQRVQTELDEIRKLDLVAQK